MKLPAVILFTLLSACLGCKEEAAKPVHLPSHIQISTAAYQGQRFLTTNTADLAFDTQNGALCKTWSWSNGESPYDSTIATRAHTCTDLMEREQQIKAEAEARVALADARERKEQPKER